ncbi:hypothetical protein [Streptomyces sp. SID4985]|uniref:hypothetical protein n=1 Tax=unclassified Streptomyces TaxID=2593676 RepID=UPI0013713CBE|nr:hypothetical protein [Streptomyces sp. SID4985]MYQ49671.1 hypothetical protein [Streptomyces sp. SID4985]
MGYRYISAGVAGVGLVSAIAALVLLAFAGLELPRTVERDRAFKEAVSCTSVPRAAADCLSRQPFTVSGIHLWSGRGGDGVYATFTAAGGAEWRTGFSNDGPVLSGLGDGDRVTGTVWRGRLVRISAKGETQVTEDSPDTLPESLVAALLVCGPSLLLLAAACGWRLRRPKERGWRRGPKMTAVLAAGLAGVGVFAAIVVSMFDLPLWAMPAVWLAPAALATALAIAVGRQAPDGPPIRLSVNRVHLP